MLLKQQEKEKISVAFRKSTGALASNTLLNFSDEWTSIAVTM